MMFVYAEEEGMALIDELQAYKTEVYKTLVAKASLSLA